MCEQYKIAQVHEEGEENVLFILLAWFVPLFDKIGADINYGADNHLRKLHKSDTHGNPAWHSNPHRTKSVVGIHKRVNGIVHGNKPSTRRRMVWKSVPSVY